MIEKEERLNVSGNWEMSGMPFPSLVTGFHFAEVRQDRWLVALGWFFNASLGTSGLRPIPRRHLSKPWKPYNWISLCCTQVASWEKNRANDEGDYRNVQQKHRVTQVNSSCTHVHEGTLHVPPSRTTADITFSSCSYLWKQSVIMHPGHDSPGVWLLELCQQKSVPW